MIARRLLYLLSFICLAGVAALAVARIGRPSEAATLLYVAVAASFAGSPGLVHRRAWPAALALLPVGAFLVVRAQMPSPPDVQGTDAQLQFYLDHLRLGARAYAIQKFPLQLGDADDLRLLLSLSVYLTTGLAAFVALSLRRPLPAVAIALAILGFAFTVDKESRVVLLPFAFVLLAGCTLMLSRSLGRRRWRVADAAAGLAVATVATLFALALLGATPVAAGKPLADWRTWGRPGTGAHIGFDWMADYPHLLDPRTDVQVMQVESPIASYWRANALDQFDGRYWYSSPAVGPPLTPQSVRSGGGYSYLVPGDELALRSRTATEAFAVRRLYTKHLFVGGTPKTLVVESRVPIYASEALALRSRGLLGPSLRYTVTAVVSRPRPVDLVGRGRRYTMGMVRYLTLPFPQLAELTGDDREAKWQMIMTWGTGGPDWIGLLRLNRRIVEMAEDPYEVTLRIEKFLRSNYSYSLTPPQSDYDSPYAAFLFDTRTGYCQHFAGAMAVLLRFNGIPARVAVGFRTGKRISRDTYAVSTNDAHSWVEAYFPEIGWIPFDPTPGNTLPGAGPSSASAGFVDPFADDAAMAATSSPLPATGGRRELPATAGGAKGASVTRSGGMRWLAWGLVPVTALVLWPGGRAAVRRRRLRSGSPEERLATSVNLVYAELRTYGVGVPAWWTLPETARFMGEYLGLDASALVSRVDAVLFGGRGVKAQDLSDLADLYREVRRGLRTRAGWERALLASYGVRVRAR